MSSSGLVSVVKVFNNTVAASQLAYATCMHDIVLGGGKEMSQWLIGGRNTEEVDKVKSTLL